MLCIKNSKIVRYFLESYLALYCCKYYKHMHASLCLHYLILAIFINNLNVSQKKPIIYSAKILFESTTGLYSSYNILSREILFFSWLHHHCTRLIVDYIHIHNKHIHVPYTRWIYELHINFTYNGYLTVFPVHLACLFRMQHHFDHGAITWDFLLLK